MLSGGCVRLLLLVLLVRLLLAAPPNKFSVVLVCPETHMYTIGVVAAALYSVPGYGAPPCTISGYGQGWIQRRIFGGVRGPAGQNFGAAACHRNFSK